MRVYSNDRLKINSMIGIFMLAILAVLIFKKTGFMYVELKLLIALFLSVILTMIISFLSFNDDEKDIFNIGRENRATCIKDEFMLIILITFTCFPLLTDGYFFHDDYINFLGHKIDFFVSSLSQGRPITGLFTDIMSKITVINSYFLRWISVFGLIFYAILLYRWLSRFVKDNNLAFLLAGILSLIVPIINVISYGSMFVYSWAFVFSGFSVILFDKAYLDLTLNNYKKTIFYFAMTFLSLLMSYYIYQVATTVALIFILIKMYYSRNDDTNKVEKYVLLYLIVYAFSSLIYYLSVKIITKFYGISLIARSELINSFSELYNKLQWFVSVLYHSLTQIQATIFGKGLFIDNWYISSITYKHFKIGIIILILCIIFILYGIIDYAIKSKKFLRVVIMIMLIPGTYFYYLILKESAYTSYYSVALTSFLLFLLICGVLGLLARVVNLFKPRVCTEKIGKFLLVILLIMIMFQSNYYIRSFWVNYNAKEYSYIKSSITNSNKYLNRIHIYGSLFPWEADIYSINACKMALIELGMNADKYKITASMDENYVPVIDYSTYIKMYQILSNDDRKVLKDYYNFNKAFSIYEIRNVNLNEDSKNKLKRIFEKTNILPRDNEKAIIIDLRKIN